MEVPVYSYTSLPCINIVENTEDSYLKQQLQQFPINSPIQCSIHKILVLGITIQYRNGTRCEYMLKTSVCKKKTMPLAAIILYITYQLCFPLAGLESVVSFRTAKYIRNSRNDLRSS